jgi:hypothetical protein
VLFMHSDIDCLGKCLKLYNEIQEVPYGGKTKGCHMKVLGSKGVVRDISMVSKLVILLAHGENHDTQ